MPAGVAYLGKLIVDAVVAAIDGESRGCGARPRACPLARRPRRAARRRAGGRAARHRLLPVAAASAAVAARAPPDPRQGADADARAVRGLGALRQAESRAARSVDPAAVARESHVRARAERRLARELRGVAVRVLAVGRRDPRRGGPAGVHRGDAVLRRALSRVPVAQPRPPHARRISRSCSRARTTRKRSSCSTSARGCSRAFARSSGASTPRRSGSRSAATAGASCSGSSRAPRSTARTPGSRSRRSTARSRSAR